MEIVKFTPEKLPYAVVGQFYQKRVEVVGAGGTWKYEMNPANAYGITMNPDGTIQGTATDTGHVDIQVVATNQDGDIVIKNY